ncbi:MAG TPA: ATP-binding protein, partial [Nitrospiraceae bacterium]|nr:ATP-binding protein [Nitrospiraceae bacterium]
FVVSTGWPERVSGLPKASPGPVPRGAVTSCALLVTLLAGLTLAEYLLDADLGIDQALVPQHFRIQGAHAGRMAPITALSFLLVGVALLRFDWESGRHRPSEYLSLLVVFSGGTALIGYFYDEQALYKVGPYTSIAVHTATLFTILGLGFISARPARGLMRTFASPSMGGVVARRVLPFAVALPILAGRVQIAGERKSWYGYHFGVALFAAVSALIAMALVWWLARFLNHIDGRRLRMEESLRRSEERYRSLVEATASIVWTVDAEGRFLVPQPSWEAFTGQSWEQHANFGWLEALHPEDRAPVLACWDAATRAKALYRSEGRLWHAPSGGYRYIASRAVPLLKPDGTVREWLGTISDIHDRKCAEQRILHLLQETERREQELRDKQAQLIQTAKLASIGELATGIAHELNNPLNNIGLFVGNAIDSLILEKPKDIVLTGLRSALQQIQRGASIINHLRAFGRTASVQMETLSINDVLEVGLSLMQEQLRLRNIEVVLDLSPQQPMVLGNQTQLEQVFVNLLGNARDAVADSSTKTITIRTLVRPNVVEISVQDSGAGIPLDLQARIFDPFFTTKPVGEGTGLGLSITYGIIKEHKGTITLESPRGGGAAFVVQLPLLGDEAP